LVVVFEGDDKPYTYIVIFGGFYFISPCNVRMSIKIMRDFMVHVTGGF